MKINKIIIHCSDSPNDRGDTAETVHRWHKERTFPFAGIGYHYVIGRDFIEAGRPEYWQGAHTRGHNKDSLGIMLFGKNDFTDWQLDMTAFAIAVLRKKHGLSIDVYGHYELNKGKTCPNIDMNEFRAKYFL